MTERNLIHDLKTLAAEASSKDGAIRVRISTDKPIDIEFNPPRVRGYDENRLSRLLTTTVKTAVTRYHLRQRHIMVRAGWISASEAETVDGGRVVDGAPVIQTQASSPRGLVQVGLRSSGETAFRIKTGVMRRLDIVPEAIATEAEAAFTEAADALLHRVRQA